MAIAASTYTLPRRLAFIRIWRKAKATHGIGRARAAWLACRAFARSRDRRTVAVGVRAR